LRSPWLLAGVLALIAAVLLAGQFLAQMPANVAEDPVARTRWLGSAAGGGAWGETAGVLGLFEAQQSRLLQGLLALAAILASVHLADALARWRALRRLPGVLALPAGAPGEALPVDFPATLHRLRAAAPRPPDATLDDLAARLEGTFPSVTRAAGDGAQAERRLLAVRNGQGAWLLPLLYLGLLVAIAALWANALLGWQVRPAAIAPGGSYTYAPRGVALDYTVTPQGADAAPRAAISATVGSATGEVEVGGSRALGGARVRVAPGQPAFWLDAGETQMVRAGDAQGGGRLGLLFPQIGSEELVVLPASNAGLRIVRLGPEHGAGDPSTEPRYLVELYEQDAVDPVQRFEIDIPRTVALELSSGPVDVAFARLSAAEVTVSRRPWLWGLIPALLLAAAGAVGLWRRPAFALVQVAPWPVERSVVTVQSDRAGVIEGLQDVGRVSILAEPTAPDDAP
jgi:hypothetical protein